MLAQAWLVRLQPSPTAMSRHVAVSVMKFDVYRKCRLTPDAFTHFRDAAACLELAASSSPLFCALCGSNLVVTLIGGLVATSTRVCRNKEDPYLSIH